MPEFENLENYESRQPDGSVRVSPIAPHSLQPVEYTPNSRPRGRDHKATIPKVPETRIEPVDIRQMEKEFRQANRENRPSLGRRLRRSLERLKRSLGKWFKRSTKPNSKRRRPQGGKKHLDNKANQQASPSSNNAGGGGKPTGSGQRKRRRRRSKGDQSPAQSNSPQNNSAQNVKQNDGDNRNAGPKRRSRTAKDRAPNDNNGQEGNSAPQAKEGSRRPRKRRNRRNRNSSNPENPS